MRLHMRGVSFHGTDLLALTAGVQAAARRALADDCSNARSSTMSSKPKSGISNEHSVTLPEGATVSVYKISRKASVSTWLSAGMGDKSVVMRVDDVSAHSLAAYLSLVIKVINSERIKLIMKPLDYHGHPATIKEFVNDMAYCGMFILQPWSANLPNEKNGAGEQPQQQPSTDKRRGCKKLAKAGGSASK